MSLAQIYATENLLQKISTGIRSAAFFHITESIKLWELKSGAQQTAEYRKVQSGERITEITRSSFLRAYKIDWAWQ